ncbi:MAG TPA: NAD(P)/FAD-dependent oxidoreductase, partial [Dictyoglomaceae bacterium]|nr:NAD(P)/FAD-dependent oxidoreductase [Dictyoglomaceae bacterium]
KVLNELSDKDLNSIWRVIKENPSIMKAVEESGDTAYQTSLLRVIPTLISPKSIKLIKLLPKIFKVL